MNQTQRIRLGLLLTNIKLGGRFSFRTYTADASYPKDPDPKNWRTINGSKVHLTNGKIDGGAGGKFKGNAWVGKKSHGHNSFFPLSQMNYKGKSYKGPNATAQAGSIQASRPKSNMANIGAAGQASAIATQTVSQAQPAIATTPLPQVSASTSHATGNVKPPLGFINRLRGRYKNANQLGKTGTDAFFQFGGDPVMLPHSMGNDTKAVCQKAYDAWKNKEITKTAAQNIVATAIQAPNSYMLTLIAQRWGVTPSPIATTTTPGITPTPSTAPTAAMAQPNTAPKPTPKPKTAGKTSSVDLPTMDDTQRASFVKKAMTAKLPPNLNKNNPTQRLVYAAKHNDPPKIVSYNQLGKLAKAKGAIVLYRTVSDSGSIKADQIADDIRTSKIFVTNGNGGRVYGGGMYMADDINDSRYYGWGESNTICAVLNPKTAKIITMDKLQKKEGPNWLKQNPKTAKELGFVKNRHGGFDTRPGIGQNSNDLYTALAVAMGYNVVHNPSAGYYTILDRKILTTCTKNFFNDDPNF